MLKYLFVAVLVVLAAPCLAGAAVVRMETVLGNIDIMLHRDDAPVTCANFLRYVNEGLYDNSLFHRSDPGFIVQGGDIRALYDGTGWDLYWIPTYDPIVNEFSPDRSNVFGTIAMAKLEYDANTGTGGPDSATSSWFFNLGDNSSNLDQQNGGFTVFGYIVDGIDVLLAIEALNVYDLTGGDPYSPFGELPTLDTYTQEMYDAGYGPYLSDLVWLYTAVLLADANHDGVVDAADFIALKRNYGKDSGATWEEGDFDGDGDVDYYDKYLLEFSFGLNTVGAAAAMPAGNVPEPATLSLLAVLALSLPKRARRLEMRRRRKP